MVGQTEAGIGSARGRLESEGIVVEAACMRESFKIVLQLVFYQHLACNLVVRHQTVACQIVNHQQRLRHIETDVVGESADREVVGVGFGILVDALHGADVVNTLNLAVFLEGIIARRFERGRADGARRTDACELDLAAVDLPADGVAIDVELVVTVDIGAVEVAFGIVDEGHLFLGRDIADGDTGIADGILLAHIEGHRGILGRNSIGSDGELERGDRQLGPPFTVEDERGRVLARCSDEFRAVHHKAAAIVDAGLDVLDDEVALIGAESWIAVFTGFHDAAERLFETAGDGMAEIVCVDELYAVGSEFRELGFEGVAPQVGIAGFGTQTGTCPVDTATGAVPLVVRIVVNTFSGMDDILVFG